jgi:hypothetical protein
MESKTISEEDVKKLLEKKLKDKHFELTPLQSIALISYCINIGNEEKKKTNGKDVTIIIGNTGAGKSTTINYLLGCTMEIKEVDEDDDDIINETIVVVVPKSEGGKRDEVMKIGHSTLSFTFVPEIVQDSETGLIIMDCPGFLDNRGSEINISNAVNIRNITSCAKNFKAIIVVNSGAFYVDRTKCFGDTIKNCVELFGSEENVINNIDSILLLITNLSESKNLDKIKSFFSKNQNRVIASLAQRIVSYDPLDRKSENWFSRKEILEKIKNLSYIKNPDTILKTNLTTQDTLKLNEIGELIEKQVKAAMAQKDYKNASKIYQNLYTLNIINHIYLRRVFENNRMSIVSDLKKIEHEFRDLALTMKFDDAQEKLLLLDEIVKQFPDNIQNEFQFDELKNFWNSKKDEYEKKMEEYKNLKDEKEKAAFKANELERINEEIKKENEERIQKIKEDDKQFKEMMANQAQQLELLREQQAKNAETVEKQMEIIRLQNEEQKKMSQMQIDREREHFRLIQEEREKAHQLEIQLANSNKGGGGWCIIF